MLHVNVDYPILHALCMCVSKKARETFWYLVQNYEKLPIRGRQIRKDLKMSKVVYCRALQDLVDYNIVHWDKNKSYIDLSIVDYAHFDLKRNGANGFGPLTRNINDFDEYEMVRK